MSELVTNKITPATGSSDTVTLGDSGDTFTIPAGVTLAGSGASLTALPAANLTGTTAIANGGTGVTAVGTSGNVLTSTGSAWASTAIPAGGFPVGARAFRGSAQTITINTWTKVQLSSETYDPNGDFDSSSDYDYTVPTGQDGVYVISGGIALDTPADAAVCFIAIYVNGSPVTKTYENTGGANGYGTIISDICDLDAGDLVTLYVRHASSGTITTTGTTDMTHLAIQRIA